MIGYGDVSDVAKIMRFEQPIQTLDDASTARTYRERTVRATANPTRNHTHYFSVFPYAKPDLCSMTLYTAHNRWMTYQSTLCFPNEATTPSIH